MTKYTVTQIVEALEALMYGKLTEEQFTELFKEQGLESEVSRLLGIACLARKGKEFELEFEPEEEE